MIRQSERENFKGHQLRDRSPFQKHETQKNTDRISVTLRFRWFNG
jgi:hypothetical protein